MTNSTMLHIRVDQSLKAEASTALEAMGLSLSDAVRLLLKRVASEQAWPLELKVPNAVTQAAMRESRAMARSRSATHTRYASAEALLEALDKATLPKTKTKASASRSRANPRPAKIPA